MEDSNQNPGRKLRNLENDGDGDKYFDTYRYTPFTTDLEFFRDPNIYEADEVSRSAQGDPGSQGSESETRPRGERPSDDRMREDIQQILKKHGQIDASNIRVDVQDGVVTLSGEVDSQDEKRMAERIARNAFGILEIKNNLNVNRQDA